jgi:hypothetical protein
MTAYQFLEWKVFEAMEPFGPEREDYRSAHIVQTISNAFRKRGTSAKKLEDFLLKFGDLAKPKQKQPWQNMLAIAQMLTSANRKEHKRALKRFRRPSGT